MVVGMGNLMLSLKAVLISTGVVSVAFILKLCVPLISDFIVSDLPSLYSVMISYLRPPYLYLLINGIIISIVASSRFQHKSDATDLNKTVISVLPAPPAVPDRISVEAYHGDIGNEISENVYSNVVGTVAAERTIVSTAALPNSISVDTYNDGGESKISRGNAYSSIHRSGYGYGDKTVVVDPAAEAERVTMDGGDSGVKLAKASDLERMDTMDLISLLSEVEKPPVSRRFSQRKTVKATQHHEGKALGVTKPKRDDTLESTWKMITEGRHMPLTRHLKKSDTWERLQEEHNASPPPLPNQMKKSDTFSDSKTTTAGPKKNNSTLTRSSGFGKLKKEPSLSQDELNRRVEAFIKKFNEEMRLQRQESLNQYEEMLSRGAH
ncbi:hypothetical protein SLE2022_016840 [Rubroshorea leprosula]